MTAPRRTATLAAALVVAVAVATPLAHGAKRCGITKGGETVCRGVNLQGADLHGADLRGTDLRGTDLRRADLRRADLRDARLDGADLRGARLTGARLHRAHLRTARLDNADLTGAVLDGADFTKADLTNARLTNAHIGRARRPTAGHSEDQATSLCTARAISFCPAPQFAGANLAGANLAGVRIVFGNFQGANLSGANYAGSFITMSNLSKANLANSSATGTVPAGAATAMRVGAAFANDNLSGASFAGANLSGTSFLLSNTTGTDMTGAYVQVTWWLNGQSNFNGLTWPATSCGGATAPWGQPIAQSPANDSCTTALPGGGTVTFDMSTGRPAATLQFPTPAPSWWLTRISPPTPTTLTIAPGDSMRAIGMWMPTTAP